MQRYYLAGAVSSAAGALLVALLLCELLLCELLLCEWCLCELLLWVAGVAAGAGSSAAKAGAAITARAMTGMSFLNIDLVSSENTSKRYGSTRVRCLTGSWALRNGGANAHQPGRLPVPGRAYYGANFPAKPRMTTT